MKELPYVVFIMRRKMSNLCVVSYIYIISSTALFLIKSIPSLPTLNVLNTSIFQFAHKHSNSSDKNQLNYSVVVFDIFLYWKDSTFKYHMSYVMIFFTLKLVKKTFTNRQIAIGQYRLIVFIRINGKSDPNFSKCLYDVNAKRNRWIVGRKFTDIEKIKPCVSNDIPIVVRNFSLISW